MHVCKGISSLPCHAALHNNRPREREIHPRVLALSLRRLRPNTTERVRNWRERQRRAHVHCLSALRRRDSNKPIVSLCDARALHALVSGFRVREDWTNHNRRSALCGHNPTTTTTMHNAQCAPTTCDRARHTTSLAHTMCSPRSTYHPSIVCALRMSRTPLAADGVCKSEIAAR